MNWPYDYSDILSYSFSLSQQTYIKYAILYFVNWFLYWSWNVAFFCLCKGKQCPVHRNQCQKWNKCFRGLWTSSKVKRGLWFHMFRLFVIISYHSLPRTSRSSLSYNNTRCYSKITTEPINWHKIMWDILWSYRSHYFF